MADGGSNIPKWVWMITPTLAVAFVGFILYLTTIPSGDELDAVKGDAKKVLQIGVDKAKQEAAKKEVITPGYEFYKLLENQTVEVPEVEAYHSTPKDDGNYQYRLQVGSFRSSDEAERMRASLLLDGLNAYQQEADVNGSRWYRVYVGPFSDRSKLNKAEDMLVERSISPLTVKEPLKK